MAATLLTGTLQAAQEPAHTGDVTSPAGSTVNTLPNVNANVGTFQGIAVNAKGQVTAAVSTSGHVSGTATNDNAAAGQVGEIVSVIVSTGVAAPTGTAITVGSIALTAGDWDVMGEVWFAPGTGVMSTIEGGINTVAATIPLAPALGTSTLFASSAGGFEIRPVCPCRASLAAPATYYLTAQQGGGTGVTVTGKLWARRAR